MQGVKALRSGSTALLSSTDSSWELRSKAGSVTCHGLTFQATVIVLVLVLDLASYAPPLAWPGPLQESCDISIIPGRFPAHPDS